MAAIDEQLLRFLCVEIIVAKKVVCKSLNDGPPVRVTL